MAFKESENWPFVVIPVSSATTSLRHTASAVGFIPRIADEASSLSSMLASVLAGRGIALVPLTIARRFASQGVAPILTAGLAGLTTRRRGNYRSS